jgi:hypothetical protein
MATKDFNTSEDREMASNEKGNSAKPLPGDASQQEEEKSKASDVKNAHASGDGSFGRNDESVPDKAEKEKKEDNNY